MPVFKNYRRDFFKKWSPEMSYVLGFLYADGNIVTTKRGTHFVSLYTADRSHLLALRKIMGSEHSISSRVSKTGVVYRIQIGSAEWFADVASLGLHPNKSRRMILPNTPQAYFGDFVRGYFDGDGNVWAGYLNKSRATATPVLFAAFTSASPTFLKSLRTELKRFGIVGGSIYTPANKNFGRLTLSTRDALKLFEIMYTSRRKPFLKRKKAVFERFMKSRTQS
jgi:hypothetical protein